MTGLNDILDFETREVEQPKESHMKDNMRVTVVTNLNGSYTLKCDDGKNQGEYLYFTPEELALGVAVHVGDGIIADMDKGDIVDIITDHVIAVEKYKSKVKDAQWRLAKAIERVKELNKINGELKKQITKLEKKYGKL